VPPVLVGVAVTFALQSRTSAKRIALAGPSSDTDRLSRLGLALRERRNSVIETAAEVLSPGAPPDRDEDGSGEPASSGAVFTPAQKRMAKHLHGLAAAREERGKSPMQLHYVYSPEARHVRRSMPTELIRQSHATIVGRTISQFPLHAIGRSVLRHWLVDFEL